MDSAGGGKPCHTGQLTAVFSRTSVSVLGAVFPVKKNKKQRLTLHR